MVSNVKHPNFLQLLGYFVDERSRILAYEFAPNGSLHDILHGMWFCCRKLLTSKRFVKYLFYIRGTKNINISFIFSAMTSNSSTRKLYFFIHVSITVIYM